MVAQAYRADVLLQVVRGLIERARNVGAPVVYLRHEDAASGPKQVGTPAWEIHSAIAPAPGDVVIDKRASDSFYATTLDAELRAWGVERVVICGMATEQCVDTTARSAQSHGYVVTVVADGHTTSEYPGAPMPAAERIAYHNFLLPFIPNPDVAITVVPAADVHIA